VSRCPLATPFNVTTTALELPDPLSVEACCTSLIELCVEGTSRREGVLLVGLVAAPLNVTVLVVPCVELKFVPVLAVAGDDAKPATAIAADVPVDSKAGFPLAGSPALLSVAPAPPGPFPEGDVTSGRETPVPRNGTYTLPPEASLSKTMVPPASPALRGANCTINDSSLPASNVSGSAKPITLNSTPCSVSLEKTIFELPEFFSLMLMARALPTDTVSKLRVSGLRLNWPCAFVLAAPVVSRMVARKKITPHDGASFFRFAASAIRPARSAVRRNAWRGLSFHMAK
jgi:hypothetical protein